MPGVALWNISKMSIRGDYMSKRIFATSVTRFMKFLKTLTWEDDWQKYIQDGPSGKPVFGDDEKIHIFAAGETMSILNSMHEFSKAEYGYTVYEAFLKATEIKASFYPLNCDKTVLQRLINLKKQDIKNLKKGIFDEELKDYIGALEKGYKEWLKPGLIEAVGNGYKDCLSSSDTSYEGFVAHDEFK